MLRSDFWLAIHVLTIVAAYAALAVALVIGNIVITQFATRGESTPRMRENLAFIYRTIQIGTLLGVAGTVLGGVWAEISWGRFWSWDSKEVWALIFCLVYLALLHARYVRWIIEWGLAAGAVVCFAAVVMAWYGVNYVLGVGKHSYGGGAETAGQVYVLTGAGLQVVYVGIMWLLHRRHARVVEAIPA